MKTNSRRLTAATLAASLLAGPISARAAAPLPNMMVEFDNSGSMGNSIQSLPAYVPATTYSVGGGLTAYTATVVYQLNADGTYTQYAVNVAGVPLSDARNSLSSYGLWFGTIGTLQLKLFVGNYLNYEFCPTGSAPGSCTATIASFTKLSIAKRIVNEMIVAFPNVRFGIMDFNGGGTAGNMVAPIGTSTTALVAAVNAISGNVATPLGPTLTNIGQYYAGTFSPYPSPSVTCQSQSVIMLTDGQFNVPNSTVGDPVSDPAVIATSLYGSQHITINAIGLNAPSDPLGAAAITDLQAVASNSGGQFFNNNTTTFAPQLEQALFSLPSGIRITTPANLAVLANTVAVTAGLQNQSCVQAVQFNLDGNPLGPQVTAAPFSYSWDSTAVLNGTHTLTASQIDTFGTTAASPPVLVITINDQTAPVISNLNTTVNVTSATISWVTNKLADTQVQYGLTTTYDQITTLQNSSPKATTHTVTLTGLNPGTQYFYQVQSRDSAGNLSVLGGGGINFTTGLIVSVGAIDHFRMTFLNSSGATQTGPGTQVGAYPLRLTAGNCFSTTIESLDVTGNHVNYTGSVDLSQYSLDSSGVESALATGIATANNGFASSASSAAYTMNNGFLFLGSAIDTTKQLCFYKSSREPGDTKNPGNPGDFHLRVIKTGSPSITGVSNSYLVWRGAANQLALVPPGESLAPATPTGLSGSSTTINAAIPFTLSAFLTDQYWNLVATGVDSVRFASAKPTTTGFSFFSAAMASGASAPIVTLNDCSSPTLLSVDDQSNSTIASGYVTVNCTVGSTRYYQLTAPPTVVAGQNFISTITIKNVSIPIGTGNVTFSGRLIALTQTDASHFAPAPAALGQSFFSYSLPDDGAPSHDAVFPIPNQTYKKAGTYYIQLVADNPSDLAGATTLVGPVTVVPNVASTMTITTNPSVVPAYTNAQITVTIIDEFGNGISSQPVLLSIINGSGKLGASADQLSDQRNTNSAGQIVFPFQSGGTSEPNILEAIALGLNLPRVDGVVVTSLLGNRTVTAYPSPVKINQRPLAIEYQMSQNSDVTIIITDLFGHEVVRLSYSSGGMGGIKGINKVTWDGRNGRGQTVAAGVYGLHLRISANSQTTEASTRFGVAK
jgi:hypothetical protein